MNITKETLYSLVDKVDTDEYDVVFQILLKFVPVDIPMEDEIGSLVIARKQILNGELYDASEIDWDKLDEMIID